MRKKKTFVTYEEKYLVSELLQTRNALAAAYSNFENVTDPDLIDSCIYQVNSVQKRYKFFIKICGTIIVVIVVIVTVCAL